MQEQITEFQQQDKDMQGQIKELKLDHCITKKTCCNKTEACPCGYERFSDMCYKISTDNKNYTDAKSACHADGGHLAMPKDKATNDFLGKQLRARPSRYMYYFAWIGLTDQVTEGTWMWEDGTNSALDGTAGHRRALIMIMFSTVRRFMTGMCGLILTAVVVCLTSVK
ncbi:Collectin-11 [Branchiostoma belcheri]|nr:Collectin-11 [Branchiostoma belcheri]